ncbi:MAG: phosphatidylinositol-specific phospholipase C domain-containing protein [Aestuariibacter sp.]
MADTSLGPAKWLVAKRKEWLSEIPENTKLQKLLIPGTHDSGAYSDKAVLQAFARTNDWSITQQLEAGIRFLDIRLVVSDSTNLMVFHGDVDQDMSFSKVLRMCYEFLEEYKTEFIFMSVKEEKDPVETSECDEPLKFEKALLNHINKKIPKTSNSTENFEPSKFWDLIESDCSTGNAYGPSKELPPNVEAARGKIILINRFWKFDQNDTEPDKKKRRKLFDHHGLLWPDKEYYFADPNDQTAIFEIQDDYQLDFKLDKFTGDIGEKTHAIANLMDRSKGDTNDNHLFVNFISAVDWLFPNIREVSEKLQTQFLELLHDKSKEGIKGIIPMDFPMEGTIEVIIINCLKNVEKKKYRHRITSKTGAVLYTDDVNAKSPSEGEIAALLSGSDDKHYLEFAKWNIIPLNDFEKQLAKDEIGDVKRNDVFYIYNYTLNEYLYAPKDSDKDRPGILEDSKDGRSVFSNKRGSVPDSGGIWEIKENGEYFTIHPLGFPKYYLALTYLNRGPNSKWVGLCTADRDNDAINWKISPIDPETDSV